MAAGEVRLLPLPLAGGMVRPRKGMAMILFFSIVNPFMAIGFSADHATRQRTFCIWLCADVIGLTNMRPTL